MEEVIGSLITKIGGDTAPLREAEAQSNSILSRLDSRMAALSARPARIAVDASPLKQLEAQVEQSAAKVEQRVNSMGSMVAGVFAGLGAKQLAESLVEANVSMDRIQAIMRAASGSSAEAAQQIAFVASESQRLGVNFESAAMGYAKLSIAAREAGMSNEKLRGIFVSTAEAATVLSMSKDQVAGTFLAFEQMFNKGTVQSEELKRQLSQYLPGAFEIFAKSQGLATREFIKMMEQGSIVTTQALPAFAAAMRETFGGGLNDAISNTNSNIQRLKNSLFFSASGGEFKGFMDGFNTSLRFASENMEGLIRVAERAAPLLAAVFVGRTVSGSIDSGIIASIREQTAAKTELAAARAIELAETKAQQQAELEVVAVKKQAIAADLQDAESKIALAASEREISAASRDRAAAEREALGADIAAGEAKVENLAISRASIKAKVDELEVTVALARTNLEAAQSYAAVAAATNAATGRSVGARTQLSQATRALDSAERQLLDAQYKLVQVETDGIAIETKLSALRATAHVSEKNNAQENLAIGTQLSAAQRLRAGLARELAEAEASEAMTASVLTAVDRELVVAQGAVAASTGLMASAMTAATTIGRGLFTLIGGWPGLLLTAGMAVYAFRDSIFAASESTTKLSDDVEKAVAQLKELNQTQTDKMSIELTKAKVAAADLKISLADAKAISSSTKPDDSGVYHLKTTIAEMQAEAHRADTIKDLTQKLSANAEAQKYLTEQIEKSKSRDTSGKTPQAASKDDPYADMNASADRLISRQATINKQLDLTLQGRKDQIPIAKAEEQWAEAMAKSYESLAIAKKSAVARKDDSALQQVKEEMQALEAKHKQFISANADEGQKKQQIEAQERSAHEAKAAQQRQQADADARYKRDLTEIKKLHDEMRTPAERYNEQMARLNELSKIQDPLTKQLVMTTEDYARTQQDAADKLAAANSVFSDHIEMLKQQNEAMALGLNHSGEELEFLKQKADLGNKLTKAKMPDLSDDQLNKLREQVHIGAENNRQLEHQRDVQDAATRAVNSTMTETEKLAKARALLAEAERNHLVTHDVAAEAIRRETAEYKLAQQAGQQFVDIMSSGMENLIFSTDDWRTSLRGVIVELEKMIVKLLIIEPLKRSMTDSVANGGGWGKIFSSIFTLGAGAATGGASGAAVAAGGLAIQNAPQDGRAFAKGGVPGWDGNDVVTRASSFTMPGGGRGLMGEAGDEAIMPLRRGPNGSLGVQGTAPAPIVNLVIHNNSSEKASAKQSPGPNGSLQLDVMVGDMVDKNLQNRRHDRTGANLGWKRQGRR